MAGFVIRIGARSAEDTMLAAARAQMRREGFAAPETILGDHFAFDFYPGIFTPGTPLLRFEDGGFAAVTGSFFYRGLFGAEALRALYADAPDLGQGVPDSRGLFAVVLFRDGKLTVARDRNGTFELFCDNERRMIASSFLALAEALPARSINRHEAFEYVINGTMLGNETLFRQITRLGIDQTAEIGPAGLRLMNGGWPLVREPVRRPPQAAAEAYLDQLYQTLDMVSRAFPGQVRLALSGGYDSRLLVAGLRHIGADPDLYVYGSPASSDVRCATAIAAGEGMRLRHFDKAVPPPPAPDEFAAIVRDNFHASGGMPWGSILDYAPERAAQAERMTPGAIVLHGGGGEVLRNFFAYFDKPFHPRQVARAFYAGFDETRMTGAFDRRAYLDRVTQKIAALPFMDNRAMPRYLLDAVYAHFRCRSWNGAEASLFNRYGPFMTPLYDHETTLAALQVPTRYKFFGDFEGLLMRMTDARLAAYPSNYGRSFAIDATRGERLRALGDYLQPTSLRQYRTRIKNRLNGADHRLALARPPYLDKIIDPAFPYLSRLFRVDRERAADPHARMVTLEYLFQHFNAAWDA